MLNVASKPYYTEYCYAECRGAEKCIVQQI